MAVLCEAWTSVVCFVKFWRSMILQFCIVLKINDPSSFRIILQNIQLLHISFSNSKYIILQWSEVEQSRAKYDAPKLSKLIKYLLTSQLNPPSPRSGEVKVRLRLNRTGQHGRTEQHGYSLLFANLDLLIIYYLYWCIRKNRVSATWPHHLVPPGYVITGTWMHPKNSGGMAFDFFDFTNI